MLLLTPILEYCKKSKKVDVLLYQFDGLTLQFKDKSKIPQILRSLKKAVDSKAKDLNIQTTLDY